MRASAPGSGVARPGRSEVLPSYGTVPANWDQCSGRADRIVAQGKDSGSRASRICHPSVLINAGRTGLGSQCPLQNSPDRCSKTSLSRPPRSGERETSPVGLPVSEPISSTRWALAHREDRPCDRTSGTFRPTQSSSVACINSRASREFSGKVRQRLMQPPRIYLTTALHAGPCIEIERWAFGPGSSRSEPG
jgi:hypothetical protein